jgi:septal ring factor EnvC (AmiA/AmiB activator)
MAVSTAWAGGQAKSSSAVPASMKSPSAAQQQLVSRQVEVKRLEQDLSLQESDSRRASERLQQQDQAIAELQKQLHELQTGSASDSR